MCKKNFLYALLKFVKVPYVLILILFITISCSGGGDGDSASSSSNITPAGNENNNNETFFQESWNASGVKKVETQITSENGPQFQGDEAGWFIDATADGITDSGSSHDCGPSPHTAEIIDESGDKKCKLTSRKSFGGCSDNIWLWWETGYSGSSKKVAITPDTTISFEISGELYSPATSHNGYVKDNCGMGMPCGTWLCILDNNGNGVFYRTQYPDDAVNDTGTTYTKIALDPSAGAYSRNLYDDFSKMKGFKPKGSYVQSIEFEVDPWDGYTSTDVPGAIRGWAIIDDLIIE